MLDPQSAILSALYNRRPEEAQNLANAAHTLTIWEAAALDRREVVARLLEDQPDLVNAYAPDGNTPLGLSAFFNAPATARLLLDGGADIDAVARNVMKVQALHAAVAARSVETVKLLIDRGADVNARQQVGYTPLMGAAGSGRDELVDLLLRHGADASAVSEDGKTPSSIAREHGHAAIADRLAAAATA
jgi:ankyrin repeat protein